MHLTSIANQALQAGKNFLSQAQTCVSAPAVCANSSLERAQAAASQAIELYGGVDPVMREASEATLGLGAVWVGARVFSKASDEGAILNGASKVFAGFKSLEVAAHALSKKEDEISALTKKDEEGSSEKVSKLQEELTQAKKDLVAQCDVLTVSLRPSFDALSKASEDAQLEAGGNPLNKLWEESVTELKKDLSSEGSHNMSTVMDMHIKGPIRQLNESITAYREAHPNTQFSMASKLGLRTIGASSIVGGAILAGTQLYSLGVRGVEALPGVVAQVRANINV